MVALLVLGAVPLVLLGVVRDLWTLLGLVPTDGELRCCCLHSQEHSCRLMELQAIVAG